MANEIQVKERGSIVEKTYLLSVNFGVMGNSRSVNSKVLNLSAEVNAKLLKINKTLLDSAELKAIGKADAQMRATIKDLCLPYDMGLDLIPRVSASYAAELLTAYKPERQALVDVFVSAYPSLKQQAEEKYTALAAEMSVPVEYLYNPRDYPPVDVVRGKFRFDWDFLSLSVPDEFKLAGKYEEANANLQAKVAIVTDEITVVMRQALLELVSHLKTQLEPNADGKPKRLFATAVTNVQDFLETFKARNITNDMELDSIAEQLKTIIHPGVNSDMLKKDEVFKTQIHDSMADIAGKLSSLVEVIPGRKFRGAQPVAATVESTPAESEAIAA
jgi:hypothetical protein